MSEKTGESPQAMLENILKQMGFEATVTAGERPGGGILLSITSAEAGRLIGRGAQVLDALQLIVSRMATKQAGTGEPVRCTVDIEGYRGRQEERLVKLAQDAADDVEHLGHAVKLPPMNSAERRVVHQALKDRPGVTTYSEETGEGGEKQVIVAPAGGQPEVGGQRSEVRGQTSEVSGEEPGDNIGNR